MQEGTVAIANRRLRRSGSMTKVELRKSNGNNNNSNAQGGDANENGDTRFPNIPKKKFLSNVAAKTGQMAAKTGQIAYRLRGQSPRRLLFDSGEMVVTVDKAIQTEGRLSPTLAVENVKPTETKRQQQPPKPEEDQPALKIEPKTQVYATKPVPWFQAPNNHDPILVVILLVSFLSAHAGCYSNISIGQVPIHIAILWILIAFVLGRVVGPNPTAVPAVEGVDLQRPVISTDDQDRTTRRMESTETATCAPDATDQAPSPFGRFRIRRKNAKIKTSLDGGKVGFGPAQVSTALRRMLQIRNRKHRRRNSANEQELVPKEEEEEEDTDPEEEDADLTIGRWMEDPQKLRASSLEEEIAPMCRLRGLDVFTVPLEGQPETDLATHPFFIEHGVRNKPTFIINAMTQWVNIVLYFELPNWIQNWDQEFVELEGDLENVIALKRFLNGDDEYRNRRFKVLPYLVDGPAPIRFMAPSTKKTATVVSPRLEARWIKHPPSTTSSDDNNSQTCHAACLELEVDLMVTSTMRSITSICQRYLRSIVADAAIIIEKPYLQQLEEPTACLGMCRFDRIDMRTCPEMPPRTKEDDVAVPESALEERDIIAASHLMGIPVSNADL